MASQAQGSKWWERLGRWFGNTANLVAVFAIVIILLNVILKVGDKPFLFLAFGTLILMVFLRYADVSRFKEAIFQQGEVPPLGLAKGSVRALLAFSIVLGFGIYIYHVLTCNQEMNDKIFTALNSVLFAVIGFYFGTRAAAAAQPAVKPSPPSISGIQPKEGTAGKKVLIENLSGTGFQADATVKLIKGKDEIVAQEVHVVRSNQITCLFDLLPGKTGKWDVVVTNPDSQTGTLPEGFEIK